MSEPYADWTTEELIEYEECLYDDGERGESHALIWFDRDQVLWELSRRLTVDLPKEEQPIENMTGFLSGE